MISSHSTFLPLLRKINRNLPSFLKQPINRFIKWDYFGLTLIVLVIAGLHFAVINNTTSFLFDETHYIAEARSIIAGQGPLFLEQPPVGKLFIISGIRIFGDNPLGWRFFSVIFGTISVVLFYFICRKLDMPEHGPFLATFVFAFENLNFTQSSVAMLDVYMVTFMLASFLLFLHDRAFTSGFFLALSTLSKFTGILGFIVILIFWILRRDRKIKTMFIFSLTALVTFGLLFEALYASTMGYIFNPITLLISISHQVSGLTFSAGYQFEASRPWEWILLPRWIFYSFDPQYLLAISTDVWILIIPVILYMIWQAAKGSKAGLFGLAWIAGTYIPLVVMVLFIGRVTFLYYFYQTIGAICLGLGVGLAGLYNTWRTGANPKYGTYAITLFTGFIILHVVFFVLLSPLAVPLIRWFPLGL